MGNIRHVACFLPSEFKISKVKLLECSSFQWAAVIARIWVFSWWVEWIYAAWIIWDFQKLQGQLLPISRTPPIKILPSPTLSSLPHPLSFLYAHTCTPHASAVSFVLYWSSFPGLHTSVCSVMWAATIAQDSHPNLFDFNRQFFTLSGLNCTLIGGGLCCHTQGALLRQKAISCTSVIQQV